MTAFYQYSNFSQIDMINKFKMNVWWFMLERWMLPWRLKFAVNCYFCSLPTGQANALLWTTPGTGSASSAICHEFDVVLEDFQRNEKNISKAALNNISKLLLCKQGSRLLHIHRLVLLIWCVYFVRSPPRYCAHAHL